MAAAHPLHMTILPLFSSRAVSRMPDITWEALLEGAVHGVKVKGTLKATLSA